MADQFKHLRDIGMMRNPLPEDPVDRANVEHVLQHGYVVIENCFSKEEAEAAKAEIDRLSGSAPMIGRNSFEGFNTNRIYSLLNKTREFDKFAILPRVLALNDFFLDPGYNITSFHTIQINPGEKNQDMHHDDAFCHVPRPRLPLGAAIIIAFDDFTAENGATGVIPGSHTWGADRRGKYEETVPMVCPAGSVVYFIGTTWHCGGANNSSKPRKSATVQYCQPYIRPIENQILAVDPRKLKEIPPRIVEMMGYRIHRPFIGYADGLNPIKAVQRMVKWLQEPVDHSPPTFASTSHADSRL
ncbi:hypothetical protein D8B26_003747 [Coccidioides posadasii str. Silveira]|uniref:Phytanoyl-CoA dioxygenase n=2 Tax=Coccidioides posadasii TaxID=199306 RepID=E9D8Q3_COCPS|nr:phytanoyl-CoA dioxygenase [Coccidioides posadasii str. Silveira]KMM69859.1 phytanoyl-CoA dioxygenase [Coccidioides posadasii RMSCC 3488]QVM09081.1 hypothetical protein D8B26_003747 [Coccidioides posadasii str. Silveira]